VPPRSSSVPGTAGALAAEVNSSATGSIDHVVLERGEIANSWRREALGVAAAPDSKIGLEPLAPATVMYGPDPDGYMDDGPK